MPPRKPAGPETPARPPRDPSSAIVVALNRATETRAGDAPAEGAPSRRRAAGSAKAPAKAEAAPAARKAAATKRPPAASPPAESASAPAPAPQGTRSGHTLKVKALAERVAAATGGKKKAVRQTVEVVLAELGRSLMAGDDLHLPPLGRARVSRQRDREGGEILTIRLRRMTADEAKAGKAAARKAAKEALAGPGEDG